VRGGRERIRDDFASSRYQTSCSRTRGDQQPVNPLRRSLASPVRTCRSKLSLNQPVSVHWGANGPEYGCAVAIWPEADDLHRRELHFAEGHLGTGRSSSGGSAVVRFWGWHAPLWCGEDWAQAAAGDSSGDTPGRLSRHGNGTRSSSPAELSRARWRAHVRCHRLPLVERQTRIKAGAVFGATFEDCRVVLWRQNGRGVKFPIGKGCVEIPRTEADYICHRTGLRCGHQVWPRKNFREGADVVCLSA